MKIEKKNLDKNQVELKIEVSLEEIKPHLNKAALKLSQKSKIPGFRPGKAPYDLVKARVGEMNIWQEALEGIVAESFYKTIQQEKLVTVGQPDIKVEKLAPGNPVVYIATVSLLPDVTLGDWQAKKIKKQPVKVEDKEIEATIKQLQSMRVTEKLVDRVANQGDKVETDFEVLINNVVIEGGSNKKYPVVLGEKRMIPGFEEKLTGTKAGDKLEFDLKFPDKYFQNHMAGKQAHFKVEVLGVYERTVPEINEEFVKGIGFTTVEEFKKQLTENIKQDKTLKENQRWEKEMLDQIVKATTINELPDNLIESEIHKMIHELEHNIKHQGLEMTGYLKSINKTTEDLHKDFRPQAIERLKIALVLRKLATDENIKIDDTEIDQEIKKLEAQYQGQEQALKEIKSPAYRQYLSNALTHQKTIKFITEKIGE